NCIHMVFEERPRSFSKSASQPSSAFCNTPYSSLTWYSNKPELTQESMPPLLLHPDDSPTRKRGLWRDGGLFSGWMLLVADTIPDVDWVNILGVYSDAGRFRFRASGNICEECDDAHLFGCFRFDLTSICGRGAAACAATVAGRED